MASCCIVRLEHKLLCFYYEMNEGIICKSYENNKWVYKNIVIGGCRKSFTITLDKKGNIYLFCQDLFGNIILCNNGTGEWTTKKILENKSDKIYTISINPIISDDGLSIIYNVPKAGDKMNYIVKQTLNEKGEWSNAVEIDAFAQINHQLFTLIHVTQELALLFYQTKAYDSSIVGYREVMNNKHGAYNVFHSSGFQVTDAAYLTNDTTIFVLYISKGLFSYQLIFRKKDSAQFTPAKIIIEAQNIEKCSIFFVSNKLYITFITRNQLYFCVSDNGGRTFSQPQRYKNKFCYQPEKAVYISQLKQNESDYLLSEIYVDSSSVWDVQLLPDLYDDFYTITAAAPEEIEFAQEQVSKTETEQKIFLIESQLSELKKQKEEKEKQLANMVQTLMHKNKEIDELKSKYEISDDVIS